MCVPACTVALTIIQTYCAYTMTPETVKCNSTNNNMNSKTNSNTNMIMSVNCFKLQRQN